MAASPHPQAAERTVQGLPSLKGKRGDECFARAAYVTVARPAPQMKAHFAAIAADAKHPQRYTAEAVGSCLAGGHTGTLRELGFRY